MIKRRKNIFGERTVYKPFDYPWAYDLWLEHEQMHWASRSIHLHDDVRDWNNKLSKEDRDFIRNVLLLFTQSDVDVAGGYIENYLPHFRHPEIRMMLLGFAARETVHIDAYSYLNETLGLPDSFYGEFLNVPVLKEKHDFFDTIINKNAKIHQLPVKIAGISAFTEGMFLFSSFVMLLNYPRNGLLKGTGQLVTWSILDEQKHVEGLIKIFRQIIQENPTWWNDLAKAEIYSTADMMTELENDFLDEIFQSDIMRGLSKVDLQNYNRYIVDRRLNAMGLKSIHHIKDNPIPWVDEMVNSQTHENFFEIHATSYAKGALTGSWQEVWGKYEGEDK
jgi:ribonucleoside-diphosphate reductase beta chain